jgi:hypothetical protein
MFRQAALTAKPNMTSCCLLRAALRNSAGALSMCVAADSQGLAYDARSRSCGKTYCRDFASPTRFVDESRRSAGEIELFNARPPALRSGFERLRNGLRGLALKVSPRRSKYIKQNSHGAGSISAGEYE